MSTESNSKWDKDNEMEGILVSIDEEKEIGKVELINKYEDMFIGKMKLATLHKLGITLEKPKFKVWREEAELVFKVIEPSSDQEQLLELLDLQLELAERNEKRFDKRLENGGFDHPELN
jgi:hypothetical protein